MKKPKTLIVVVGIIVAFVAVLSGGILLFGLGDESNETRVKQVAVVLDLRGTNDEKALDPLVITPLAMALENWGYTQGENVNLTMILPGAGTLEDALQALAENKPDAIVAVEPEALVAVQAVDLGIPVVFQINESQLTDEIRVQSHDAQARITGVVVPLTSGKRFQLLMEMVPGIQRVFVPYNPENDLSAAMYKRLQELAPIVGVTLIPYTFTDLAGEREAMVHLPADADAIFIEDSGVYTFDWARLALQNRIPLSVGFAEEFPEVFMGFGMSLDSSLEVVARFIGQILDGTKPNDLPIEYIDPEFVISLGAADAIGIEVSDTVLRQATLILRDEVVVPPLAGELATGEGFCMAAMTTMLGTDSICITTACTALQSDSFVTYAELTEVEACPTEGLIGICSGQNHDTYFYSNSASVLLPRCRQVGGIWTMAAGLGE